MKKTVTCKLKLVDALNDGVVVNDF